LPAELGIIWALIFGVPAGLLGLLPIRSRQRTGLHQATRGGNGKARGTISPASVARAVIPVVLVLFVVDSLAFYYGRPMMSRATGFRPAARPAW
jgi:hypothetical protein